MSTAKSYSAEIASPLKLTHRPTTAERAIPCTWCRIWISAGDWYE